MNHWLLTFVLALPTAAPAEQSGLLRCAFELKQIHPDEFDSRLFLVNGLLIGSARVHGGRTLLFIANERVSMAYPLTAGGTGLRIEFPHADPRKESQTHFFQYTHSDVFGSKLGNAGIELPPAGKAPSDYAQVKPATISQEQVRRQLVRLIADQVHRVAELHAQGKLGRADLLAGNLSLCRGLARGDPRMAQWLDRQIGELELASTPSRTSGRIPAGFK